MKYKLCFLILFSLLFSSSILGQQTPSAPSVSSGFQPNTEAKKTFVTSIELYQSSEQKKISINSLKGWYPLSRLDPALTSDLPPSAPGTARKWRLHVIVNDQTIVGSSTIQVRLNLPDRPAPLFTLPWRETPEGVIEKYSNWFESDSALSTTLYDTVGESQVRLVSQSQTNSSATLYSVNLEAWDIEVLPNGNGFNKQASAELASNIDAARTPYFPQIANPYESTTRNDSLRPSKEQALQAALSFVNIILNDDLPSYYNSFSELVQMIDKGALVDRYNIAMPLSNYNNITLAQYKDTYNYQIYTKSETLTNFAGWSLIENSKLNQDDFLFIGTNLKSGRPEIIVDKKFLIFIIRKTNQGWKITGVLS